MMLRTCIAVVALVWCGAATADPHPLSPGQEYELRLELDRLSQETGGRRVSVDEFTNNRRIREDTVRQAEEANARYLKRQQDEEPRYVPQQGTSVEDRRDNSPKQPPVDYCTKHWSGGKRGEGQFAWVHGTGAWLGGDPFDEVANGDCSKPLTLILGPYEETRMLMEKGGKATGHLIQFCAPLDRWSSYLIRRHNIEPIYSWFVNRPQPEVMLIYWPKTTGSARAYKYVGEEEIDYFCMKWLFKEADKSNKSMPSQNERQTQTAGSQ